MFVWLPFRHDALKLGKDFAKQANCTVSDIVCLLSLSPQAVLAAQIKSSRRTVLILLPVYQNLQMAATLHTVSHLTSVSPSLTFFTFSLSFCRLCFFSFTLSLSVFISLFFFLHLNPCLTPSLPLSGSKVVNPFRFLEIFETWGPYIDGELIKEQAVTAFQKGHWQKEKPVLLGEQHFTHSARLLYELRGWETRCEHADTACLARKLKPP